FSDESRADEMRVPERNVVRSFLSAQEVATPRVAAKSGKSVNITSVRGLEHCGRDPIMDYSAAKAALISFTMPLAKQLAPHVNVNAVGPATPRPTSGARWRRR